MERHHILSPRVIWDAQKPARELRQTPELIPSLDHDTHSALHRHVGMVVVPNNVITERVMSYFEPTQGDTLATVDNLLFALEDVSHHFRDRRIERRVIELVILGIDEQREYIRDGMPE